MSIRILQISILIFFSCQLGIAQSKKIKRVFFEGEEYMLYPKNNKLNEWNYMPSYWKENIIRKKYKLKKEEKTNGKWIQFYEGKNKIPAKTFSLLNGKVEGELKTFHQNGKIQSIRNYKQENIVNLSLSWFRNGKLKDSTIYKLDVAQNGYVFSNKTYRMTYFSNVEKVIW